MVSGLPDRVGGALVLDFVNTRDAWLSEPHRREYLEDYGDLLAWAGARPERAVDAAAAAAVHARALALREALFAVFAPLANGEHPAPSAVAAVNAAWARLETRPQLDPVSLQVVWTPAPDALLGPVLASAARLLRDGPLDRLRQCPGPDGWCGWLFVDSTRNRSRRWCSMAVCGNPAKMRARAERKRAAR